jgi:hypothetical protein
MWEAVLVLFIAGLAVSRFASMINELISNVLPTMDGMGFSAERLVTWIVAAGFSVVAVLTIEYDPLAAIGIAGGADDIWNILLMFAMVDAASALYAGRIIRR